MGRAGVLGGRGKVHGAGGWAGMEQKEGWREEGMTCMRMGGGEARHSADPTARRAHSQREAEYGQLLSNAVSRMSDQPLAGATVSDPMQGLGTTQAKMEHTCTKTKERSCVCESERKRAAEQERGYTHTLQIGLNRTSCTARVF